MSSRVKRVRRKRIARTKRRGAAGEPLHKAQAVVPRRPQAKRRPPRSDLGGFIPRNPSNNNMQVAIPSGYVVPSTSRRIFDIGTIQDGPARGLRLKGTSLIANIQRSDGADLYKPFYLIGENLESGFIPLHPNLFVNQTFEKETMKSFNKYKFRAATLRVQSLVATDSPGSLTTGFYPDGGIFTPANVVTNSNQKLLANYSESTNSYPVWSPGIALPSAEQLTQQDWYYVDENSSSSANLGSTPARQCIQGGWVGVWETIAQTAGPYMKIALDYIVDLIEPRLSVDLVPGNGLVDMLPVHGAEAALLEEAKVELKEVASFAKKQSVKREAKGDPDLLFPRLTPVTAPSALEFEQSVTSQPSPPLKRKRESLEPEKMDISGD